MIDAEYVAAAGKLLDAQRRSPAAFRASLARVPIGVLAPVVEALALMANQNQTVVDAIKSARDEWSEVDLKRAHASFQRGLRDVWTVEGERCYQRRKKRGYRLRVVS